MHECGPRGATHRSACPVLRHSESSPLSLSVLQCGAAGSASGQTACPIHPTLRQSPSRHGHVSPLSPGCPSPPLLLVWMNVYFLFPWCRTSLLCDFLSFLVVRGGAVCLPMPPSWFSPEEIFIQIFWPFKNLTIVIVEAVGVLFIFWMLTFTRNVMHKYFLPPHRLLLHSVDYVL